MRRNMWIITLSLGFMALPSVRAEELPTKPWPFTAAFMGSASCYGLLAVREKTISWLIHYSQCQRVPFEVIEQWGEGNERNVVFRLLRKQSKCRFNIIHLNHDEDINFGIGWNVYGYRSLIDYVESKNNNWQHPLPIQGCYLYLK